MSTATVETIQRVHHIVGVHPEWFRVVADWYLNQDLPLDDILERLFPQERDEALPGLTVNGQALSKADQHSEGGRSIYSWSVPRRALAVGANEIVFRLDNIQNHHAFLADVAVELARPSADPDAEDRVLPDPRPTPFWSLAMRIGHGFRIAEDSWSVQVRQTQATFKLWLMSEVPARFTLRVAASRGVNRSAAVLKLLKEIWDAIENKRAYLEKLLETLAPRDPQAAAVKSDLEDLNAYQRLQRVQLDPAFRGGRSATLKDAIRKPAEVSLVREAAARETPADKVPRDRPPPLRRPDNVRVPRKSSALSSCFTVLLVLGLLVGGAGYAVYYFTQTGQLDLSQVGQWFDNPKTGKGPSATDKEMTRVLNAKGAKTGDVQVSLYWNNKNDLDLHVECPTGEVVFFGNKLSKSGGQLDVDMNVVLAKASAPAVENIHWPVGKAPAGHYKVYVNLFSSNDPAPGTSITPFQVRVVNRGDAKTIPGSVDANDPARRKVLVAEFDVK